MNREDITNQYLELRGCKIKRTYLTKSEAKAAAKMMSRHSDRGRLRAYSCKYCPDYHIGHNKPSHQDRLENQRIERVLKNAV